MKLEVGKLYRTRSGKKAEVIGVDVNAAYPFIMFSEKASYAVSDNGIQFRGKEGFKDIVSEWYEGPIRTVTHKEIVTGEYGKIGIIDSNEQSVRLNLMYSGFDASDLRNASKIFIELADALEENNRRAS